MTTNVSNSKTRPAVIMDKLHVDSLVFRQERLTSPKRGVAATGILYGLDENDEKIFDDEQFGINDTDIDSTIIKAALASGKTLVEFGTEYAAAKTTINDKIAAGTMSDAELMAYFEAALGRIFELHSKINVSGVE